MLPLTQQITQQLPQIIDWCNAHLHAKFDYAYLGAIEDVDGEYFLSGMVPESMPTGLFFAFACSDDELMFRLTWNGDVY
ncbi:MAG: hypothetical protein HC836_31890 [Richelia sp. RM2_1_2]|nr:hypothetical protein [Richelia sp. RM2_1_2]